MNIAVVGTGYVGLVSGTCFAEMGVNVTCVDVNQTKIESLQKGEIPIYEPGLDEMVLRNQREGRLKFTTALASVLDDVEMVFSAVALPPMKTVPLTCSTFSLLHILLARISRNIRFL